MVTTAGEKRQMPQVYPLHSVLQVIAAALVVGASLGGACALVLARRRTPDRGTSDGRGAASRTRRRPGPMVVGVTKVPRRMRVDELDQPALPSGPLVPARLYDLVSREWITTTAPMPAVNGLTAVRTVDPGRLDVRSHGRPPGGRVGGAVRG
jgi:hypothetical protein